MSLEVAPSQGPPRPPGGASRIREGPYGSKPKKTVSFTQDFPWGPQPESMDSSASAPAAIVPMQEQNTVPKRPREEEKGGKKKKPAVVVAQTPPSLPPPPPDGAAVLKAVEDDARTVAYADDNYQDDVDDNQTVAYGDQPEEIEDLPVSAAAAPPRGDKRKEPEHVPLLPIHSDEPDEPDYTPVLRAEKKGKSVLTPSSSSSSSKGPSITNQSIW
jgi:hypothetical protein